ncbi:MAG TPA: type II secretion system protein GspG [Planctomycetota bacterium]
MGRARGFTLVEMIIVIAVILVVASLALGLFASNIDETKRLHTEMLIQNLDLACKAYQGENGAYPPELSRLFQPRVKALDGAAALHPLQGTTRPPYLELRADWVNPATSEVVDAWGGKIRYANPGQRNKTRVDVWSAGPNGQDGDVDDVGNWKD